MISGPQRIKVEAALECIHQAFDDYNASFADITRRARRRFVANDRVGMTQDVSTRYALYDEVIHETISRLEQILGDRLFRRPIWVEIKKTFAAKTADYVDVKLYRTFFNTISRRLFKTTGVDEAIEFTATDAAKLSQPRPSDSISQTISLDSSNPEDLVALVSSLGSQWPGSVSVDTAALQHHLSTSLSDEGPQPVEMLDAYFYRGGRAYRVGYMGDASAPQPIVFVFASGCDGIWLEAVLLERQELSILFGYTFNYFMADLDQVEPVIYFLSQLLPSKPIAELYTVLGRVKQGKTERYQSFFAHLQADCQEALVEAEGKKGMVMLVFTLPSYPLVFKLIRDRFAPSKQVTRTEVLERYHLVFRHDRIGRLIDAQEFRELKIPLGSLSKPLLDVIESQCQRLVERSESDLIIHHCYVERRVRPLDLYLAEADEASAMQAVIDYGQSIKDLARSNIFAGDLLPKNFGVTGSGRVVFYDYDELRLMSECHFRHWPEADDDVYGMSDEPWFYVGENDVFPEQFSLFMGLGPERLALLKKHHQELFDADWWRQVQADLSSGQLLDVPPFTSKARL